MHKKICTFGFLAVATLMSFPSVAKADLLTNVQNSDQEAAAVGDFNEIRQTTNQINVLNLPQPLNNLLPGSGAPSDALSGQNARQAAGAVGDGNKIQQETNQSNLQRLVPTPPFIPGFLR